MAFYAYRSKAIHTSENRAFIEVCKKFHYIYHNTKDEVYVLGGVGFKAYDKKTGEYETYDIDMLIFINGTLIVVDVKGYGGTLRQCGIDQPWLFDDDNSKAPNKGKGGKQKNPYRQIERNKEGLVAFLIKKDIYKKKKETILERIFGCVLYTKPIVELTHTNESLLDPNVRKWFKVSDLENFHTIIDSFYNDSKLSGKDIEILATYTKLDSYNTIDLGAEKIEQNIDDGLKKEILDLLSKLKTKQKQLKEYTSLINTVKSEYQNKSNLKELINKLYSYSKIDVDERISQSHDELHYDDLYYNIIPSLIDSMGYSIRVREFSDNSAEYGGYTKYAKEYIEKAVQECESDIANIEKDGKFEFLKLIYKNPSWFDNITDQLTIFTNAIEKQIEEKRIFEREKQAEIQKIEEEKKEELERLKKEKQNEKNIIINKIDYFQRSLSIIKMRIENENEKSEDIKSSLVLLSNKFEKELDIIISKADLFDFTYNESYSKDVRQWGENYAGHINKVLELVNKKVAENKKKNRLTVLFTILPTFLIAYTVVTLVHSMPLLYWVFLIVGCSILAYVLLHDVVSLKLKEHIFRFGIIMMLDVLMSDISFWIIILVNIVLILLDFYIETICKIYMNKD